MAEKKFPIEKDQLEALTERFPTPFHIYDEQAIRANARRLKAAFAWNPGFKEYFAVKAAPNPYLMKILKAEGFGSDCSSYPELLLSEKVGIGGEDIIFTSNDTPAYEYQKAKELGRDHQSRRYFAHCLPRRACRPAGTGLLPLQSRSVERKETRSSVIRKRPSMVSPVSSCLKAIACCATRA